MLSSVTAAALSAFLLAATEGKPVFEDRFEGKLAEGWTWLRENRPAWRIEKDALEIRVEPGVADTVKNALLRPAPDRSKGKYAIDLTVTSTAMPTNQFEQGGITWYCDGKPVFKIVKELIDGKLYIIPGKVPMESVSVQLRVIVSGDRWIARFRPEAKGEFVNAGEGKLPPPGKDQVSIQCYNGPADAEHWIRFDDFRILELESGDSASPPAGGTGAAAAAWTQYYGPDRTNISKETGWKSEFPAGGPRQLWKINVGVGASSFTLKGGKLFTMGNAKEEDQVLCLDSESGNQIWKHTYPCKLDKRNFEGGPGCTPTLDGGRVYTVSHEGHLFCLDEEKGTVVWGKHIIKDLGGKRSTWGYACSPLVEKDLLIVDAGGKGSSTVALDKATGEVRWKAGDDSAGYSSPVAVDLDGRRTLIIFKGKALVGLDPADGKELWRHPWKTDYDVNAAMPLVLGNRIFISSGYNRGCALLEVSGGRIKVVWENKNMRNHVNSCVHVDGFIYGFDGNVGGGKLNCLKVEDGSVAWSEGGMGTGSVAVAGGKLIALGEQGQLAIAPVSPQGFKPSYKGQGIDGHCWVVPVLSGGRLYLRNNMGDLVCLDMK